MLNRVNVAGLMTLLVMSASSAAAQMTPIARLSCTAQNFPSCGGWGPAAETQNGVNWWTRTLQPGAGPGGADAVELRLNPNPGGQYYIGWFSPSNIPVPA